MTTIVCAGEYVKKIIDMKKNGMATYVKTLIIMDDVENDLIEEVE